MSTAPDHEARELQIRNHLRQAARSVLQAGLAAVDAAERRDQARHAKPAEAAKPTSA